MSWGVRDKNLGWAGSDHQRLEQIRAYYPPTAAVPKSARDQVIVGASAASFPNSSGANARTVVVRAFPDDVIATAN
jgi:hypothetical protein